KVDVIIPEGGAASPVADISPTLLQVAKAHLAVALGSHTRLGTLVSFSRDADARVRRLAVDAVAAAHRAEPSLLLEVVLLAGLFDPDDTVVDAALRILEVTPIDDSSAQDAVEQRLRTL